MTTNTTNDTQTADTPRRITKAEVSRQRVLDAAATVLRDRGYAGATIRAIARAAGVEASSLYYHFRSKDELIDAVFDFGMNAVSDAVYAATNVLSPDATPRQRLETAIAAHVAAILRTGDYTLAIRRARRELPRNIRRAHSLLRDTYARFWHDLLANAQRSGAIAPDLDLGHARLLLFGALNWTVEWFDPRHDSTEKLGRESTSLLLNGLFGALRENKAPSE